MSYQYNTYNHAKGRTTLAPLRSTVDCGNGRCALHLVNSYPMDGQAGIKREVKSNVNPRFGKPVNVYRPSNDPVPPVVGSTGFGRFSLLKHRTGSVWAYDRYADIARQYTAQSFQRRYPEAYASLEEAPDVVLKPKGCAKNQPHPQMHIARELPSSAAPQDLSVGPRKHMATVLNPGAGGRSLQEVGDKIKPNVDEKMNSAPVPQVQKMSLTGYNNQGTLGPAPGPAKPNDSNKPMPTAGVEEPESVPKMRNGYGIQRPGDDQQYY